MSLIGWLVAGGIMAVASSLCKSKEQKVIYVQQRVPVQQQRERDMQRVSDFLAKYNSLQAYCEFVFGKDQYNAIKKLANAIKFNSPRNDVNAKKVVSCLYDIVEFRNRFLGHNVFGIGAIPVQEYIEFMSRMRHNLYQHKEEYIQAYQRFLNYKSRQSLTYRSY